MKNFKFDLNAKVAIYVPSTTDVKVMTKTPAVGEHFEEVYTLATEIRDEMKQEMDKGMKKSALCETGRVPGRADRNIKDLDGFFDRIEAKNKVELRKAIKKRLSLAHTLNYQNNAH